MSFSFLLLSPFLFVLVGLKTTVEVFEESPLLPLIFNWPVDEEPLLVAVWFEFAGFPVDPFLVFVLEEDDVAVDEVFLNQFVIAVFLSLLLLLLTIEEEIFVSLLFVFFDSFVSTSFSFLPFCFLSTFSGSFKKEKEKCQVFGIVHNYTEKELS